MKRNAVLSLLLALLFVISPFSVAWAEDADGMKDARFIMPASLEVIEDGAFESTAAKTVVLQEGVLRLGDGAFDHAPYLTDIYIPSTVEYIGNPGAGENRALTVHGESGSYAEEWAREHQLVFVPTIVLSLSDQNKKTLNTRGIAVSRFAAAAILKRNDGINEQTADDEKSMRPQDRAELNPIDYRFP